MNKLFFSIFLIIISAFSNCDMGRKSTEPEAEPQQKIEVHFIDVGQGDCIFIKLPEQTEILIDAGGRNKGELVVDYLNKQKVDDIELMVASHPHADHIGGLAKVLEEFQVEKIIDSGQDYNSATYRNYISLAKAEPNCKFILAQQNQIEIFGEVKLKVLFPPQPFLENTHSDINANSVVILLDYKEVEILFTGDICTKAEKELIEKYGQQLDIEILKIAHHGSKYSTSEEFVKATTPVIAIIQVGKNNRYGHPHQETLDKLANANIKVYRNDLNGNVVVLTDGQEVETKIDK
jgi:competence protein ComEC